MGFVAVKFPGHVSRENISDLIVQVVQYVIYMRGQFPFPFEQGKKYVNELRCKHDALHLKKTLAKKPPFEIYCDPPWDGAENTFAGDQECVQPPKARQSRSVEQLTRSVQSFENYFDNLRMLLNDYEVQEVVLNFGTNFRNPKELFHIKLPGRCTDNKCSEKVLSFDYCRRYLFRALVENQNLFNGLPSEVLFSVSVMLLVTSDIAITECLEQKPSYSVPTKKRTSEVELTDMCQHCGLKSLTKNNGCDADVFAENSGRVGSGNEESSSDVKPSLWVQLKPVLKGFRDCTSQF